MKEILCDEYLFNRDEWAEANRFIAEHEHSRLFYFKFGTGSGIGTNVYITCEECGKKEDITDYDFW